MHDTGIDMPVLSPWQLSLLWQQGKLWRQVSSTGTKGCQTLELWGAGFHHVWVRTLSSHQLSPGRSVDCLSLDGKCAWQFPWIGNKTIRKLLEGLAHAPNVQPLRGPGERFKEGIWILNGWYEGHLYHQARNAFGSLLESQKDVTRFSGKNKYFCCCQGKIKKH